MPNYKHEALKKEFTTYCKKNRLTGTRAAWQFAQERGINHKATDTLPSMTTVYDWSHELIEK
jgi:hypothetical protein